MEAKSQKPKLQFKHQFPIIFYDKTIMSVFWKFLPEKDIKTLKTCLRKTGMKAHNIKSKGVVEYYILVF